MRARCWRCRGCSTGRGWPLRGTGCCRPGRRARALVPLGRRLAEAMGAAEAAGEGSAARAAALERVAAVGVEVWASVDPQSEGLRGLLTEALRGVRGEAPSKVPQAAEGFGQRW